MEFYTLGPDFQKQELIDTYVSAIWTERYADSGDFALSIPATVENRALLVEGTLLSTPASEEVMLLESVEIKNSVLKVTGFSLDKAPFEARLIIPSDDIEEQSMTREGAVSTVVNGLVIDFATAAGWNTLYGATLPIGVDGARQAIANLVIGEAATGASQKFSIARGPLYDEIKKICQGNNTGWKLIPANVVSGSYDLEFSTWNGRNLTSDQATYPIVRFSPALDTLAEITELRSISGYRTVAYAISPGFDATTLIGGSQFTGKAYAYPSAETETGFGRRTLLVAISGITIDSVNDDFATYQAIMNQHAKDALANNNFTKVVDGEVVPQSEFQYGTHYGLGDIVELQDNDGYIQKARITEYIRTQDANGSRAYPTVNVIE